ncbi:hypothetical protein RQP53_06105 [Paucibacter sp. APW11]|uniref:CHAD domain-containing protein n=1 Tax=Roseateles aquae TaxID=3077235 RepID=A0ABU3P8D4_9BURK|nr:hypothetical protein [Paucibacter sp. APW11]MDT8998836.1 hypothetical protein [Paucibacter sp. APW11]
MQIARLCRWSRTPAAPVSDTAITTIYRDSVPPPRLLRWRQSRLAGRSGESLLQSILRWLPGDDEASRQRRQVEKLRLARRAFLDGLADLSGPPISDLRRALHRARSTRDLWHLRNSFYTEVGRALSQWEAERRLQVLNVWFEHEGALAALARVSRLSRLWTAATNSQQPDAETQTSRWR